MIRVIYANYESMDRETRLKIIHDGEKPTREVYRNLYTEVKRHKFCDFGHKKGIDDSITLDKVYEYYNLNAQNLGLRSMSVGDLIEIGTNMYIVAKMGFERVSFKKDKETMINKGGKLNVFAKKVKGGKLEVC